MITITIESIDMSAYLVEDLSIDAEEGRSVVASFHICDSAKLLDHDDLNGGTVVISYSGTLLFTGKIRSAAFDPFLRLFEFQATDYLEDVKDFDPSWIESELFHETLTGQFEFDAVDLTKVHGVNTLFTTELRPGQRIWNGTDDLFGDELTGISEAFFINSILYDTTANWPIDGLIGKTVYNETDGSSGAITDNTDANVYSSLAGGTNNFWTAGDVYRIKPGFNVPVSVESIESATELTLSDEYSGTTGAGKIGKRIWGLYFELVNGKTRDTLDLAIKALSSEWAVLEKDKNDVFRISDCQANVTPDVLFDEDNFLFHSVRLKHHDPNALVNAVDYEVIHDYSVKRKWQTDNDLGPVDAEAEAIVSTIRNTAVDNWKVFRPIRASQVGFGSPPHSFTSTHIAKWTQQKRKIYALQGYKCTDSITKYGLKKASRKTVALRHDSIPGCSSFAYYAGDTLMYSCTAQKLPDGYSVNDILAGWARSAILDSHRLVTVSMEMPIYTSASRELTIQGTFPNLTFIGKTISYSHRYSSKTGRATTKIEVTVIPPLT